MPYFQELEACLIEDLKGKEIMSSSFGDSTLDDLPLGIKIGKKKLISKEKYPLVSNPELNP